MDTSSPEDSNTTSPILSHGPLAFATYMRKAKAETVFFLLGTNGDSLGIGKAPFSRKPPEASETELEAGTKGKGRPLLLQVLGGSQTH